MKVHTEKRKNLKCSLKYNPNLDPREKFSGRKTARRLKEISLYNFTSIA